MLNAQRYSEIIPNYSLDYRFHNIIHLIHQVSRIRKQK